MILNLSLVKGFQTFLSEPLSSMMDPESIMFSRIIEFESSYIYRNHLQIAAVNLEFDNLRGWDAKLRMVRMRLNSSIYLILFISENFIFFRYFLGHNEMSISKMK